MRARPIAVLAILMLSLAPALAGPALAAPGGPQTPAASILAQPGQAYIHVSTDANTVGDSTYLSNPALNGQPMARLLVTANALPYDFGVAPTSQPLGVWFNPSEDLWAIYNDDSSNIPTHLSWNVFIPPQDSTLIMHTSTALNTVNSTTFIDDILFNITPTATVFVQHYYNSPTLTAASDGPASHGPASDGPASPQGAPGTYYTHTVSVIYDNGRSQWGIHNNDGSPFPPDINFFVLKASADETAFKHVTTITNHPFSNATILDHPALNNNPDALLLITQNDAAGVVDNHQTAVNYDAVTGRWYIYNIDGALPLGQNFNVLVIPPKSGFFVHAATPANITSNRTALDNPDLNNNPNALIQVAHNWNPPESNNHIYHDHPFGVRYISGTWYILNTDGAAMPPGITFNVYYTWPRGNAFASTASTANTSGHTTQLTHPLLDTFPNAIPILTFNQTPAGLPGGPYTGTVGVKYDTADHVWDIFNETGFTFSLSQTYNVFMGHGSTSFVVTQTINSSTLFINNALTNHNPGAMLFVTPRDHSGINPQRVGVYYDGFGWDIFNEAESAMPLGSAYDVFVVRFNTWLPLVQR